MIAVLGATGRVGSLVAATLAEQGADARAVVRTPKVRVPLKARQGDLTDPRSMRRALRGVDRLFLLTPHTAEQAALEACALQAALDVGVAHIVKISGGAGTLGPNGTTATAVAHWQSEQAIERSGVGFTFLRPSFFAQNLLDTVAPVATKLGFLPTPFGGAAIAMIDARDVAASAVAVLTDPAPTNGAWSITGPRGVTFDMIAKHLGIRTIPSPPRLMAASLARSGAQAGEIDHALRMAAFFRAGSDATPTDHVARLTGQPPRPVEALLDEHRSAFAPTTPVARAVTRLTTKEHR